MAFPSAWPRLCTSHKSLKIQALPAPPRLNYALKQIGKIATQLVKISLILERIQEGLDHMARTQVSLMSGVLKKMVANFYFLSILTKVFFKGKVVEKEKHLHLLYSNN